MDAKLHAIDADTGKRCADFGDGGVLDINVWNTTNAKWPLSILQPPTVYEDTLFIGWAGRDWTDTANPPGTVFAVDARTGKLKWTFNATPKASMATTGTGNVWASMSIDEERGILYLPVSSPSPNFYGGERKEDLPLTTSIAALDTETGEVLWSRQLVHHDIWDYDTSAPPTLVDLQKDGEMIPALVEAKPMRPSQHHSSPPTRWEGPGMKREALHGTQHCRQPLQPNSTPSGKKRLSRLW